MKRILIPIIALALSACAGQGNSKKFVFTKPNNDFLENKRQPAQQLVGIEPATRKKPIEVDNQHLNLQNSIYWQDKYYLSLKNGAALPY